MDKSAYILGIETSCDETASSVVIGSTALSNVVFSQIQHEVFGGVVPELASRIHLRAITSVVRDALDEAKVSFSEISAVAVTVGPGLIGALLVGSCFARSLAMALGVPLFPVNHLQAHVLAQFIEGQSVPKFPFLSLLVSGGHTQIILVMDYFDMEVLGSTKDDAVGEAYDKAAKMLGLVYPGGPAIDKRAFLGNDQAFSFSKARVEGLDFSFSGIKTALMYLIKEREDEDPNFIRTHLNDLCASFQFTVIGMLLDKLSLAIDQTGINRIAISGGVAMNMRLRLELKKKVNDGWKVYIPNPSYTTDNAAMVAMVGSLLYHCKEGVGQEAFVRPRYPIGT